MNVTLAKSIYSCLLVATTAAYAADPVTYTSLGAQDFLATYNPATTLTSGFESVAQNAATFALSPDGATAYVGLSSQGSLSSDSTGIAAVSIATGQTLWKHGTTFIYSVSVSPDGEQVYSLDPNAAVLHIYNAATGALLSNVTLSSPPTQAAATPDHSQIYVTGIKGISVVDGNTFKVTTTIERSLYSGVAVSKDGSKVYLSATSGGAVGYIIDTSSNTLVKTIPGNYGLVGAVVLSPDGSTAYFGSGEGLVEVSTATNQVTGFIASPTISESLNLATDGTYAYYSPDTTRRRVSFSSILRRVLTRRQVSAERLLTSRLTLRLVRFTF